MWQGIHQKKKAAGENDKTVTRGCRQVNHMLQCVKTRLAEKRQPSACAWLLLHPSPTWASMTIGSKPTQSASHPNLPSSTLPAAAAAKEWTSKTKH
jgi:hypothetical protein